jgi:hypothetical protein
MKAVIVSVFVGAVFASRGFTETMEFPAGTATNLEIPAGASIKIDYASVKGGAVPYMKFQLRIGESTYALGAEDLSPTYINGPATLISVPAVLTPTSGIPYKSLSFEYGGYTPGTEPILYDANGNGDYSTILFYDDSRYQAYLNWRANGNTPISANAYIGTELGSSGVLIKYTRYSNQPYRSLLCLNNSTQTINIPAGKKLIIPHIAGQRIFRAGGGGIGDYPSSFFYFGPTSNIFLSYLNVTFKGGYPVKISGFDIEGPEIVTITFNQQPIFGGGGSATTSGIVGPEFAVFTYYFADEYNEPISDSAATAIASKITSTAGNYGIATKSELTSALTESRTAGVNSVLSNPNLWTLYTTSQIQNMAVGDLVLTRQVSGGFVLNYDIEQSTDLQTWTPYQALSLPLTGLPTDKAFVRIKAKQ